MQKARIETKKELEAGVSVEEEMKSVAAADPSLTPAQVESRAIAKSQLRPETCDAKIDGTFADGWDVNEVYRNTTAPVLILQGDPTTFGFQPDTDVQRMAEHYATSTAVKFYGLGHGLDYGIPGAPFDTPKGFLDSQH